MKKLQIFFSHPCGILCDLSIEKWDNIRNMRERYVVSAPGNSLYESCVLRCSPTTDEHLRATAGRIHFDPIFPKTREYPCAYVSCHSPIKYISAYFISSWSDNCNICSFFRKKFDENRKTLPFSSLVFTGVKGEIQLTFKPFDFVFTDWDRLPDYMRPGLEPIKGAHVCWGLPWISTLKLENIMSNILLIFLHTYKYTCEYSTCTIYYQKKIFTSNGF